MKKENLFFLVMVLMAAVIAGATIGIVGNFDIIVNRVNIMNSEAQVQKAELADGDETTCTPTAKKAPAETETQPAAISGGASAVTVTSTTSDVMVVTPEEKAQINEMLHELGMAEGGDYNQFIKDFQQKQNLPATGSLDSRTLRIIINKTTEQKARQAL